MIFTVEEIEGVLVLKRSKSQCSYSSGQKGPTYAIPANIHSFHTIQTANRNSEIFTTSFCRTPNSLNRKFLILVQKFFTRYWSFKQHTCAWGGFDGIWLPICMAFIDCFCAGVLSLGFKPVKLPKSAKGSAFAGWDLKSSWKVLCQFS